MKSPKLCVSTLFISILFSTSIFPITAKAAATIRCESWNFRYTECGSNISRAWVTKQLSSSLCYQGSNYGVSGGHIWVKDGCRADFGVEYSTRELSVSVKGSGIGMISSDPTGINCDSLWYPVGSSPCSESYTLGTMVTLEAQPYSGIFFAGWSGDCSGTGNCYVTMNQDRRITATFSKVSLQPVLNVLLSGPTILAKKQIGSSGGVVEVTDTSSSLNGVKLFVPEGTFSTSATITIGKTKNPTSKALPLGAKQIGDYIHFESSHLFDSPIIVVIPFSEQHSFDEKTFGVLLGYNDFTQEWEAVAPVPTTEENQFVGQLMHFSTYTKAEVTINDDEIMSGFSLRYDTIGYRNIDLTPYCPGYDNGICDGIAKLATSYFNSYLDTYQERLICRWDEKTAGEVACQSQQNSRNYLQSLYKGITGVTDITLDILPVPSNKWWVGFIRYQLKENKVITLHSTPAWSLVGHAVVVVGIDSNNGLWIYNVNDDREMDYMENIGSGSEPEYAYILDVSKKAWNVLSTPFGTTRELIKNNPTQHLCCDAQHPEGCDTQPDCEYYGGYWADTECVAWMCSTQQEAGSDSPETHTYNMGTNSGSFQFSYNTYNQEDQIKISQDGIEIFNTGCVGEQATKTINLSGLTAKIVIQVIPNCDGGSGTSWNYTVSCP